MFYKERYEGLLKTEEEVKAILNNNCCIENNKINEIRVLVTGHFGNCVSLDLLCENICPIPLYNSTHNIGFILRALIDIFDLSNDDSVDITVLKNIPIRLVFDSKNSWGSKAVAIGHFMKDRFIIIDELMKISQ